MKKLYTTLAIALMGYCSYAQTNTFPPSGNVGIGTTTPVYLLDLVSQQNAVVRIYDTFGSPALASNPQIILSGGPPVGASVPTNYAKIAVMVKSKAVKVVMMIQTKMEDILSQTIRIK